MNENKSSWEIAKPLLLSLAVIVGMIFGSKLVVSSPVMKIPKSDFSERHSVVAEALRYINSHYVDTLNMGKLNEVAMTAIISQLDPHSAYIPPLELQAIQQKMQGHYKGIGIEFLTIDDTIYITKIIEESPASKIGLQIGDKVISYNNIKLSGSKIDPQILASKMLEIEDDNISITVNRDRDTLEFQTVREKILTTSIPIYATLEDNVNYIKIESFNADTYKEFMEAVEDFHSQGAIENLIIDVRDNPGGYLDAVIKIISQLFEEKDKMIVYTEGLYSNKAEYKTSGKSFFKIENIVVLVNEASASASEILAGAIQDHDRGLVIGKRTFGKGLVQEQYPLSNGGAIRLTVSKFYTPSGRSIQKDFLANIHEYENEIYNRQNDSLFSADSVNVFSTSAGRKVFGGGGISPDILIGPISGPYTDIQKISNLILVKDILKVYEYLENKIEDTPLEYFELRNSDFKLSELENYSDFHPNTRNYIAINEKIATNYFIEKIMDMRFGALETIKHTYINDNYIMKAIEIFNSPLYSETLRSPS